MRIFLLSCLVFLIAPAAKADLPASGTIASDPSITTGHPADGTQTLSRAGRGARAADLQAPCPPSDLAAVYDHSSRTIHLVWSQSGEVPVTYWRIYFSPTSGGPYKELGRVDNDGRSQQAFSAPLEAVPPDGASLHLMVVSFRNDDIFSSESREVNLVVERGQEPPGRRERPGIRELPLKKMPVMAARP